MLMLFMKYNKLSLIAPANQCKARRTKKLLLE